MLVLVVLLALVLVLVLVLGDGDRGGDGDSDSDCGCDDERYLLKLSISSIYCGQTATFHCPCVPAFVALSLSLSVSLSLSCKSFVVSIRLEVAASSGHLKNTFILVPNTTIHSFHQQL